MSKRFAWLLGFLVLIAIAVLAACGTAYNPASDGLMLVSSQGSGLLETFTFSLSSGSVATVYNSPTDTGNQTCVLNGIPSTLLVDPAGQYAYTIITASPTVCGSGSTTTGIAAFKINSDGTMKQVGSIVSDPNPQTMIMDSTGKYLFVAEGLDSSAAITNPPAVPCPGTTSQYGICVYSVSSGTLTPVPGTFVMPHTLQQANFAALAVTPMTLPGLINGVQIAACSGNNPPTNEFLYAVDSANYEVWEFTVDPSTGTLGGPGSGNLVNGFASGPAPAGVSVDPCDRFVYVSNSQNNTVSAYTLCAMIVNNTCPNADGSLNTVAGSPYVLSGGANGPGPLLVDPFGNFLYVLDKLSNQISIFRISSVTGSLTANNPATAATGSLPESMVIRSDGSWMFVANFNSATVSQFALSPEAGTLSALPPINTDNWPWGVAVK
ncbi:MAG TPA: beta-propeller fold lactonase family protein [Verrucomicrobiae bacterium]|nr:beta-propeller fold lactonase family protein [Verrucomicrobiae bacterium]